jgi:hypothetical protein
MNGFFASAARNLNPLIGLVITVAGGLIGGKLAGDQPIGILLGIVGGSAIAIGLCGAVAMLGKVIDAIDQSAIAQATAPATYATAAPATYAAAAPAPAAAAPMNGAGGHAAGANGAAKATNGSAEERMVLDTENLDRLMQQGRFAEYHLVRARAALAAGDYKDAAYQAGASLSHEPRNREARSIRAQAKKKR